MENQEQQKKEGNGTSISRIVDNAFLNKNGKIIIFGLLIIFAIGSLFFYFYKPSVDKKDIGQENGNQKVLNQPTASITFGDISNFVRKDISQEDIVKLKKILENFNSEKLKLNKMLENAYKKSDPQILDDVFMRVENTFSKYKKLIIPFIATDKIKDFEIYFQSEGADLEDPYISK